MTYQMWQLRRDDFTIREVTVARRSPSTVWVELEGKGNPRRHPRRGESFIYFDSEAAAWRCVAKEAKKRVEDAEADLVWARAWRSMVRDEMKARRIR